MPKDVDDILGDQKKKEARKKGINSGQKGDRGEREVAKILNKRFLKLLTENIDWGRFYKAEGSGAFGHRHLSDGTQRGKVGDLICPDHFNFVVESKLGYNDVIDLNNAFYGGHKKLDEFLEQVEDDAGRTKSRKPLLIWRKDRQKHLVFVKTADLPSKEASFNNVTWVTSGYEYSMTYRDWTVITLVDLLTLDDNFFFDGDVGHA